MFFSGGVIMILAHAGSGDGGWAGWDLKAGVFFISTLGVPTDPDLIGLLAGRIVAPCSV